MSPFLEGKGNKFKLQRLSPYKILLSLYVYALRFGLLRQSHQCPQWPSYPDRGYNQVTNILFDCINRVKETLNMYSET